MSILLFCLLGMVLGKDDPLFFSFRSQYDGYIIPHWEDKHDYLGKFYEDAVVVTPTTIVLGDGYRPAKGFSGIYSHFQCLKLTNFLLDSSEVNAEELLKKVHSKSIVNNFDFNLQPTYENNILPHQPLRPLGHLLEVCNKFFKSEVDPDNNNLFSAYEKGYRTNYEKVKKEAESGASDITEQLKKDEFFKVKQIYDEEISEEEAFGELFSKTKEDFGDVFFKTKKGLREVLSCLKNNDSRFNVATTLVYLQLKGDTLMTGVAGDSGYLIFRLDSEEQQMKLVYISPEIVGSKGSPHTISSLGISGSKAETHKVQEGDIVLVASDGVLNFLPISFLTAATNFLVHKMLDVHRQKAEKITPDPDFDYSYDLAGFAESYLDNLGQLTQHLRATPTRNSLDKKLNKHKSDLASLEAKVKEITKKSDLNPQEASDKEKYEKEITSFKEIISSLEEEINKEKKFEKFEMETYTKDTTEKPEDSKNSVPSYLADYKKPSQKDNEKTMNWIYDREICNTFDPTHNSRIFKSLKVKKMEVAGTRFVGKRDETNLVSVNCFEERQSVKKTSFYFDLENIWKCDSLEKLSGKTGEKKNEFYSFDECVSSSTPRLQDEITQKEIALSFNSRYFARNIGLAAKFVSTDERVKISESTKTEFRLSKNEKKAGDISVTASALTLNKNFDQINLFNEVPQESGVILENEFLKKQFDIHAEALKYMMNLIQI